MKIYLPNKTVSMDIHNIEKVNLPIITTLEETGIDLTAACGCIIWIDSTTGKISATTYHNGEMIPVRISATDPEKEALNAFAESLYH